jgi:hypothetical protein
MPYGAVFQRIVVVFCRVVGGLILPFFMTVNQRVAGSSPAGGAATVKGFSD